MTRLRWDTALLLGVFGAVVGAIALASFGALYAVAALGVLTLVVLVGARVERGRALSELLRFNPTEVRALDATDCGIDATDPRLLALSSVRDGPGLLRYVPREVAREIDRRLCRAIREERSVVVAIDGESTVGKSRCLFELLRHRLPGAFL